MSENPTAETPDSETPDSETPDSENPASTEEMSPVPAATVVLISGASRGLGLAMVIGPTVYDGVQ